MKTKEKLSNFFSVIKNTIKGADLFLILVAFSLAIGWYITATGSVEKFETMREQQKELLKFKANSIKTMGYQNAIIDSQNEAIRDQIFHIQGLKGMLMQLMQELDKRERETKPRPKPGF